MGEHGLAAWKLPFIVAAIAVPIVGGFYLGGPGLGMAVGALAAAAIVVAAVRNPPRGPIVPAAAPDSRPHLLVILDGPLEEQGAVEAIAHASGPADPGRPAPEVLLLARCRSRFLQRWTSDIGPARDRAQRSLVLSVASLAKAGIEARGRVGDEDLVQMVEDELRTFPATEVILAAETNGERLADAVRRLESRLQVPLWALVADPLRECDSDHVSLTPPVHLRNILVTSAHPHQ